MRYVEELIQKLGVLVDHSTIDLAPFFGCSLGANLAIKGWLVDVVHMLHTGTG
jgi:hypothetical protein